MAVSSALEVDAMLAYAYARNAKNTKLVESDLSLRYQIFRAGDRAAHLQVRPHTRRPTSHVSRDLESLARSIYISLRSRQ